MYQYKLNKYRHKLAQIGGMMDIPLIKKVDIKLSKEEQKILNDIVFKNQCNSHFFYDKNTKDIIKKIIDHVVNDNVTDILNIILRIIKKVIDDSEHNSAIIDIRVTTKKTIDYIRWHRDGLLTNYDNNSSLYTKKEPVYKFVMTLKGKSTLFITDEVYIQKFNDVNEDINVLQNAYYKFNEKYSVTVTEEIAKVHQNTYNKVLMKSIGDNYITSSNTEGVYFLEGTGGSDLKTGNFGAIHSEPLDHNNRLFISILPINKKIAKKYFDLYNFVNDDSRINYN
jgi:hypothetical protein